jgi:primosomal protein N' (replication factor Y)
VLAEIWTQKFETAPGAYAITMTETHAEQLALDGLAPRKRRKRAAAHKQAHELPVVQVVLDVQATHLGQTFDYLIDERFSVQALPGVMVRVRFGGQRVNGVIWNRVASSHAPASALRYIERVLSAEPLVGPSMREDITMIADAYGGTRANILRLAVPARVARVDKEREGIVSVRSADEGQSMLRAATRSALDREFDQVLRDYDSATRLRDAIEGGGFASFVLDMLPGAQRWAGDLALLAVDALASGKSAVLVLPGMRETRDIAGQLSRLGLRAFDAGQPVHSSYHGDFIVLSAALPPVERYRAYCAAASGAIRCVIGTRAAMYAPVEGPGLFAIVEDAAYQNADGMMPYANARGVLRLRAKAHRGVFVAMANARSPISQWEVSSGGKTGHSTPVSGASREIKPLRSVVKEQAPWIRWLNREELTRLADATVGARVPHFAVRTLGEALERGPVLLSIPHDGVAEALSCAQCHRQARCPRCTGPLMRGKDGTARCRWCGAAAANWHCPHCSGERMRAVRVGAAGTAAQLQGLFRGVPMVLSSPSQGIIESVPCRPMLVIATPGAEPRVRPDDSLSSQAAVSPQPAAAARSPASHNGDNDESEHASAPGNDSAPCNEYAAVAILDAWTSLYAPGVDARVDALNAWMRAVSLCAPRSRGGQALLIGESDPVLARSLVLWDSSLLAMRELEERAETGLPPVVACACVWGRRDAVMGLLRHVGALDGDLATLDMAGEMMPAVLGPVPIAAPRTMDAHELEATRDRVKAVIRAAPERRAMLALRLRDEVARHVAAREPGELRFQVDPKDLL